MTDRYEFQIVFHDDDDTMRLNVLETLLSGSCNRHDWIFCSVREFHFPGKWFYFENLRSVFFFFRFTLRLFVCCAIWRRCATEIMDEFVSEMARDGVLR